MLDGRDGLQSSPPTTIPREESTLNAVFSGRASSVRASSARGPRTFDRDRTEHRKIEPDGLTLAEAGDRLIQYLARAIASACRVPRRPPLRLALIDPRAVDPRSVRRD
jgi:hypothetical protein